MGGGMGGMCGMGCGMAGGMGGMGPMAGMGGMNPMQQQQMMMQQQMMGMMGIGGMGTGGKKRPRPDDQSILGEFVGVIKSFNPTSGFGFIACDEVKSMGYDNDVFLHHSHLGNFDVGAQVKFTCYLNSKGQPQCRDLEPAGTPS